jgi:hypothetical protein
MRVEAEAYTAIEFIETKNFLDVRCSLIMIENFTQKRFPPSAVRGFFPILVRLGRPV